VIEHLVIDRIGHRGDGVVDGPVDGSIESVFVPGTLPGETVEVETVPGHPDRRQLLRVEKPSPERIAPVCPHFGICGGCAMQHWQTSAYYAWKRSLVVEALRQAGVDAPVSNLIDAHGDGRRRAVFHARRGAHDILEVGFSAARAHQVIPIDRCPILAKGLDGALKAAWAIAELLSPLRKPLDIHTTATDGGLDIDVRGSGPLTAATTTTLAALVAKHNLARLTRHGELVAQARAPALRIGLATVLLPPAAFLQATAEGQTVLARLVSEICAAAKPKKGVVDLFAGIGPFALRLAEQTRVTACDDDDAALAALSRAANTSGLKPVTAERRDLFKNPYLAAELNRFDAVVFDPPRQGAQAQSREIAASHVSVVAAVSCNPGTFARDARILLDGGYRLTGVTPVDQFRYSAHVELVARFEK
jgi:23S rRNA (uracil1939-C5)-methyltransferase